MREKEFIMTELLDIGDKVVRIGEETGRVGRVRDLRYDGRHAYVSFSGLSPTWIRADRLKKLPRIG